MTDPEPVRRFRAAEGAGPWLHPPRARKPRPFPWITLVAVAFMLSGFVASYAFGEVTPPYQPAPGETVCMTPRC